MGITVIVWGFNFKVTPQKNFKNYAFNSNIIIHTLIVLTWRNCLKIKFFYTFWAQLSSGNKRDMRHCRVVCLSIFYYVSNLVFRLSFCFRIAIAGPSPITPTQGPPPPPPPPTFPQKPLPESKLSIWGNHEKTRERSTLNETLARALSSFVINAVLSCRLPLPGIW